MIKGRNTNPVYFNKNAYTSVQSLSESSQAYKMCGSVASDKSYVFCSNGSSIEIFTIDKNSDIAPFSNQINVSANLLTSFVINNVPYLFVLNTENKAICYKLNGKTFESIREIENALLSFSEEACRMESVVVNNVGYVVLIKSNTVRPYTVSGDTVVEKSALELSFNNTHMGITSFVLGSTGYIYLIGGFNGAAKQNV